MPPGMSMAQTDGARRQRSPLTDHPAHPTPPAQGAEPPAPGAPPPFWRGPHMTSEPIRDPVTDHLLTPQNAALVVIDYQPSQIAVVSSIEHELLLDNIVSVARLAKTYDLPIVLSTVNVANGQGHTLPELKAVLSDNEEIDRTQINSWEDVEFRRA